MLTKIAETLPDDWWVRQLKDNDKPNTDENEGQVGEDHETTNTTGVGAEWVGCRHGLHSQASLHRVFGLYSAHPTGIGQCCATALNTLTAER